MQRIKSQEIKDLNGIDPMDEEQNFDNNVEDID